jgi:hypothetical protein
MVDGAGQGLQLSGLGFSLGENRSVYSSLASKISNPGTLDKTIFGGIRFGTVTLG